VTSVPARAPVCGQDLTSSKSWLIED